jgi:TolA-binding protein
MGFFNPIRTRIFATVFSAGFALLGMTGCNDRDKDSPAVSASPRPEALQMAISEIRAGQCASAQARCETFLAENKDSDYAPEAHYLCGQAMVAQGDLKNGKQHLERAIDDTDDRTLKALGMLARADCNMALGDYTMASRQYHWLETMYRDVKAIPQDELMYKLGMSCKKTDAQGTADYWFRQVIESYATGPYYEKAKMEHSAYAPDLAPAPRIYTLEVVTHSKQEKAEADAQLLREKGYRDVEVIQTTRNDHPVYEVHVGKFENRSDALRAYTDADLAGLHTKIRPAVIEPLK